MGALRQYGRGWARTFNYFGTATRTEFWSFTAINAVVYPGVVLGAYWLIATLAPDRQASADFAGFFFLFSSIFAATVIMLVPWTSLLVRRVRDATGSAIAAFVLVLIVYGSLIGGLLAWPLISVSSPQNSLAGLWFVVLAFATVAIVCALPSRERDTQAHSRPVARSDPERERRVDNDVVRLYGRGWARTFDYFGTATRAEFWSFTLINAVIYAVLAESVDLTGFLYLNPTINVVTVVILLPWTPLLVRRVRDATGSDIAAAVLVLVAYGSLIAVPVGIVAPTFLLLAVLGLLTLAIVCALPSREPGTAFIGGIMARAKPEPEQREADDPWAR